MHRFIPILATILLATGCGGTAPPDGTARPVPEAPGGSAGHRSGLAYLLPLAGQYPAQVGLWSTEPLHARLLALLGDQYVAFVKNMEVQGPLETYGDGIVWTSGNLAHQGGVESAVLLADTRHDAIEVYLLTEGRLWHHAEREPRITPQGDAATMIANLREAAATVR